MVKYQEKHFSLQQLFVILVLAMFLVFSMLLVVLGAMCYCGLEDQSNAANQERILCAFVRSAVRTQEMQANVLVEDELLVIENDYDGDIYRQYIYAHEGKLKQQFISAERTFSPENGDEVCDALSFVPRMEGNLLTVDMQDGTGNRFVVYEAVKTEGGSL